MPPSFDDRADAQLFISLLHEATGLFANVQSPSIAQLGDFGIIDAESASFRGIRGSVDAERRNVERPRNYVFCSRGVSVNGSSPLTESEINLSTGITFEGTQASAVLVLHRAIRMTTPEPPLSHGASQELTIRGLYHTQSFALLLSTGPFSTTIRIQEDDSENLTWDAQFSSVAWRTFTGHLLTPLLSLSSISEQLQLPWASPNLAESDIPERSPLPREIWIELADTEETSGGSIPEVDPNPTQLWVDLEDVEEMANEGVPEVVPHPNEIWIDLLDETQFSAATEPRATPQSTRRKYPKQKPGEF